MVNRYSELPKDTMEVKNCPSETVLQTLLNYSKSLESKKVKQTVYLLNMN